MHPAAIAFMLGDTSPEVLAELRAAMVRWSEQTGDRPLPLNRVCGMGGPRSTRIDLRNALMLEAWALLEGTCWRRCKGLAEMARTFNVRLWPIWRRDGIPADASAVEILLFRACEFGEPLPVTPHGWRDIVMQNLQAG
jgi:hypothetical protein